MTCGSGAQRVQNEYLNHWPNETYPAGCYNPNSRLDGGGLGPHARNPAEAIDIGIEVPYRGRSSVGQTIFMDLYAHRARLGIVQLIYSGQIWSATTEPGLIRPYTANLHLDHIHCQFTPAAATNPALTRLPFGPTEEDDLTPQQADTLNWIAAWIKNGGYKARSDGKPSRIEQVETDVRAIRAQVAAIKAKLEA